MTFIPLVLEELGDRVSGIIFDYPETVECRGLPGRLDRMICIPLQVDGEKRALWVQSGALSSAIGHALEKAGITDEEGISLYGRLTVEVVSTRHIDLYCADCSSPWRLRTCAQGVEGCCLDRLFYDVRYEPPDENESLIESPMERLFWHAYREHEPQGLTGLRPQVVVGRYRVDFGIPQRKIAIEIDGFDHHSSREDLARDRQRQRELESAGWRICRFSGREVHQDAAKCVRSADTWAQAIGT